MKSGIFKIALALTPEETWKLERWIKTDADLVPGIRVQIQKESGPIAVVRAADQELLVKATTMVRALTVGFDLDESTSLLSPENYLLDIPFKPELPPRDRKKNGRLPKSRLDSFNAANLRVVENFTGVRSQFQNDRLWLLGPSESLQEAAREVSQIIMGRTRGTVQQFHRGKHGKLLR